MKPFDSQAVQSTYQSPLGTIHLLANAHALLGLWFKGQDHFPALDAFPSVTSHPVHDMAHVQLREYFSQQRQVFSLPLDYSAGTDFQQAVWRQLTAIAPGTTSSYAAIAQAIGKPGAVRAVGGAIGRNPLSIVVPCHRVIGSKGQLTGYAGGLPRKIALLQLESAF
jgi:methylated-DNA-[protein]-cysteine S-methyltransferase